MWRKISSESRAWITEGWLLQTSLNEWTNVKKICQHPLWGENSVKLAYMTELLSRNHCWGKQKNVKRLQWTKALRDWIIQQWNKVLPIDESKFEIFRPNRTVYVRLRVGERAATPWITPTVKHGGGSIIEGGGFCYLKSQGLAPREGQIESDRISQRTAASRDSLWNAAFGSKIYTRAR